MYKILIMLFIVPFWLSGQTVEYDYDDAGNRIIRRAIVMKVDSSFEKSQDTISELKEKTALLAGYMDKVGDYKVIIYPNPTSGQVYIDMGEQEFIRDSKVVLHSQNGKFLKEYKLDSRITEIDISKQKKGMYLLSIIVSNDKQVWKLIKQ